MHTAILIGPFLRISGVIFYFLLFAVLVIQITKPRIAEKIIKITLPLAIVHPLLFVAINYFVGNGVDPYVAFINACVICRTPTNFYNSIGMAAFWFSMFSLFLIFKKWKYANVLIYLAFFAAGIHAFYLGIYFRTLPVLIVAGIAYAVVLIYFFYREVPKLFKDFREWVKS